MPHMGWNQLHSNSKDKLIEGLHNEMFYFLLLLPRAGR